MRFKQVKTGQPDVTIQQSMTPDHPKLKPGKPHRIKIKLKDSIATHVNLKLKVEIDSKINRAGIQARLFSQENQDRGTRIYKSIDKDTDKLEFSLTLSAGRTDKTSIIELESFFQEFKVFLSVEELVIADNSQRNPNSKSLSFTTVLED